MGWWSKLPRKKRRNPYVRIMAAAETGRGVRLKPDEVWAMSLDTAIATHANHVLVPEIDAPVQKSDLRRKIEGLRATAPEDLQNEL